MYVPAQRDHMVRVCVGMSWRGEAPHDISRAVIHVHPKLLDNDGGGIEPKNERNNYGGNLIWGVGLLKSYTP